MIDDAGINNEEDAQFQPVGLIPHDAVNDDTRGDTGCSIQDAFGAEAAVDPFFMEIRHDEQAGENKKRQIIKPFPEL